MESVTSMYSEDTKHKEELKKIKKNLEENTPKEIMVVEYLLNEIKKELVVLEGEKHKKIGYDPDFEKVFGKYSSNKAAIQRHCLEIRRVMLEIGKKV